MVVACGTHKVGMYDTRVAVAAAPADVAAAAARILTHFPPFDFARHQVDIGLLVRHGAVLDKAWADWAAAYLREPGYPKASALWRMRASMLYLVDKIKLLEAKREQLNAIRIADEADAAADRAAAATVLAAQGVDKLDIDDGDSAADDGGKTPDDEWVAISRADTDPETTERDYLSGDADETSSDGTSDAAVTPPASIEDSSESDTLASVDPTTPAGDMVVVAWIEPTPRLDGTIRWTCADHVLDKVTGYSVSYTRRSGATLAAENGTAINA